MPRSWETTLTLDGRFLLSDSIHSTTLFRSSTVSTFGIVESNKATIPHLDVGTLIHKSYIHRYTAGRGPDHIATSSGLVSRERQYKSIRRRSFPCSQKSESVSDIRGSYWIRRFPILWKVLASFMGPKLHENYRYEHMQHSTIRSART